VNTPEPAAKPGFWRRRVALPLRTQLTQGVSPEKLAQTLAVGTVCSLFPFLGTTSLLNLGVGLALRLNQPILQTFNQLLGPVQLLMIVVYVRLGEQVWGAVGQPLSIAEMVRVFKEASFAEFLERFGLAGLHALTAWALTAPLLLGLVYGLTRPLFHRWARKVGA